MHPSVERIIALKPQLVLVSTASQLEAFTNNSTSRESPSTLPTRATSTKSFIQLRRWATSLAIAIGPQLSPRIAHPGRRGEVATRTVNPVKVFYQVSGEPLYTIGREAYLTDLVRRAGGVSVTADVPGAFPRFSDEAALAARPEAIILPSGGSMEWPIQPSPRRSRIRRRH